MILICQSKVISCKINMRRSMTLKYHLIFSTKVIDRKNVIFTGFFGPIVVAYIMNKSLTIRKRIGGKGEGGEVQKQIYSRKGKLENIRAIQVTLKIFIHWSKRIHAREMLTKNVHATQKFPSLPNTFSNGPSPR